MEKRISTYEKFINSKLSSKLSEKEMAQLSALHNQMVNNFQHERLIHLIIMLFFVALSLGVVFLTGLSILQIGPAVEMLPLYILTVLLLVLVGFYIKHYYFLENHIQKLYDVTIKLNKL